MEISSQTFIAKKQGYSRDLNYCKEYVIYVTAVFKYCLDDNGRPNSKINDLTKLSYKYVFKKFRNQASTIYNTNYLECSKFTKKL